MKSLCKAMVPVVWALLVAAPLAAQQPGKPKDPCPLARPKPLCSVAIAQPDQALQKISTLATGLGFNLDSVDSTDGELQLSRKGNHNNADNLDKVLIWVEHDLQQPTSRMKIYFLYGRFEKFFANEALVKVVADPAFENGQVGDLKTPLNALCLSGGGQ